MPSFISRLFKKDKDSDENYNHNHNHNHNHAHNHSDSASSLHPKSISSSLPSSSLLTPKTSSHSIIHTVDSHAGNVHKLKLTRFLEKHHRNFVQHEEDMMSKLKISDRSCLT